MRTKLDDLHFKHTLASGREIRLSVHRTANQQPRVVADSIKDFDQAEIREYLQWRERIVGVVMSSLTPGEVIGCAEYGEEVTRRARK